LVLNCVTEQAFICEMASAFVALQGYGSDSSEDADSNNEDMNLHLKPLASDSSAVSFSNAISVYSAPAVAIKVVTYSLLLIYY